MIALLSAACAPTVQSALAPTAAFDGPRFAVEQARFVSFDGARLGLSAWLPEGEPWAVMIGAHGMNDYGEAFYLAGPYWANQGVATYAYDARGHGRSPARGIWPGETLLVSDLRAAVDAARLRHPDAIIAVVGDSMGAATSIAAFASDDPPNADRLILVAPAVWGWSTLPQSYALALWIGAHVFPFKAVTPPANVQRKITPSDNREMLLKIGRDPNMIFETRIDAIYGLVGLMESASRSIGQIDVPVAFLYGANDDIIPRASAENAASRLPRHARTALYVKGYHMLLRDLNAEIVWRDALSFVRDPDAPFPSGAPPLLNAGKTFTTAE